MKKIQLIVSILLFTAINTFVYADITDMYGTYESIYLRNIYATRKNIPPDQKEAFERMRISIIINENYVEMILGGNNDETLKWNYYIIKHSFILAYDDSAINVMYYPIYFKKNIIYAMGQSFEKNESNK